MRKFLFFVAMAIMSFASAQRPFIGKWVVNDNNIKFRVIGSGTYTWERTVDPTGGTAAPKNGSGTFASGLVTIDLPTSSNATYHVAISPNSNFRFVFENAGLDPQDISEFSEIIQWGEHNWNSMLNSMFYQCVNLKITATDVPKFSNVTDMSKMFWNCRSISSIPNIGKWNVSNVTNMSKMFNYAENFNDDISTWDTSKVTDMSYMFCADNVRGSKFDKPVGNWNVQNVTNMEYMFTWAKSFNQPLTNWNVGKVTNMYGMFAGAITFNQALNNWNTINVTNMSNMFNNAAVFNQNLNTWNVSNVENFNSMFKNAQNFNQPLSLWNISKAQDLQSMFENANSFNQNLGSWIFRNPYGLSKRPFLNSIFDNAGMDCANYGGTLLGWANAQDANVKPSLGATNISYGVAAVPFRNMLLARGWTITGDYLNPDCGDELSLNETKNIALQMFPNPTADYFKMNSLQADVLSLYDMSGKLMKTQKLTTGQNTVDISNFPKGVYIAKTNNASAKIIKK